VLAWLQITLNLRIPFAYYSHRNIFQGSFIYLIDHIQFLLVFFINYVHIPYHI